MKQLSKPEPQSEELLIEAAKTGHADAFARLISPHRRRIYAVCFDLTGSHDDAQDIAQETFIKAYKGLPNFSANAAFSTWLYRIAVNAWIDHRRRNARHESWDGVEPEEIHDTAARPDVRADSAIMAEHIGRAVEQLSPQQRAVFVLRHYHELALAEIATSLGVTEGTVKTLLFRALKRLRELLQHYRD